jgi:hypothetical protein
VESINSKRVEPVREGEKNMIWVSVIIIISGSKIDDGDDSTVGDSDNDHSVFDNEVTIINAVVVMMIVQCSARLPVKYLYIKNACNSRIQSDVTPPRSARL